MRSSSVRCSVEHAIERALRRWRGGRRGDFHTGVVTGFFCVIKLLECCIDDVHHDVALQIERQEFIQCRVGVRPSRLT